MDEKQEVIELLIMEEITGVISPVDSVRLKQMIEEDPAIRATYDRMKAKYTDEYIRELDEELERRLAVPVIRAKIKQSRIRRRNRRMFGLLLVFLIVSVIYVVKMNSAHEQLVIKKDSTHISLEIAGGKYVDLENAGSLAAEKELGIEIKDGRITYKGGTAAQLARLNIPINREASIVLFDGTIVQLKSGSTLEFPLAFYGSSRNISIWGAGSLDVASDASRPFNVNLPHMILNVLGTSFNVNTRDDESVTVVLKSGSLKVRTTNNTLILSPGEGVNYKEREGLVAFIPENDSDYNFTVGTVALKELLPLLSRAYGKRVVLDAPEAKDLMIVGEVDLKQRIDQIVRGFPVDGGELAVKQEGDSLIKIVKIP